jgi:hypothetical protein
MRNIANRVSRFGPGGRDCPCCNSFHGPKGKKMLGKMNRRRISKLLFSQQDMARNEQE